MVNGSKGETYTLDGIIHTYMQTHGEGIPYIIFIFIYLLSSGLLYYWHHLGSEYVNDNIVDRRTKQINRNWEKGVMICYGKLTNYSNKIK